MDRVLDYLVGARAPEILLAIGALLMASLFFENYLGLRPRPEMRKWAFALGLSAVLVGVLLLWRTQPSGIEESAPAASSPWIGSWTHRLSRPDGSSVTGELKLVQTVGNAILGTYDVASSLASDGGLVLADATSGTTNLEGRWANWYGDTGRFLFVLQSDPNSFTGYYSVGDEHPLIRRDDYWNGIRMPDAPLPDLNDLVVIPSHQVMSQCARQGSKGISLRTHTLHGPELVHAQSLDLADDKSLISFLPNGHEITLLEEKDGWYLVVTHLTGELTVGFLSSLCADQPTIVQFSHRSSG